MKRWVIIAVAAGLLLGSLSSLLLVHWHLFGIGNASAHRQAPLHMRIQLERMPQTAYKYHLCEEAYALSTPQEHFKTDFTFHDPFRNSNDTITPRLVSFDPQEKAVSFSVKVVIGRVATFTQVIAHISEMDGVALILPDTQAHLQRSSAPQFVVSSLDKSGTMAVIDFTCSEQWQWTRM